LRSPNPEQKRQRDDEILAEGILFALGKNYPEAGTSTYIEIFKPVVIPIRAVLTLNVAFSSLMSSPAGGGCQVTITKHQSMPAHPQHNGCFLQTGH
jgi:hypothetical protein